MMKQQTLNKNNRQRKFLMTVPVLVLPFIAMLFWALGGGKVQEADGQTTQKKGFNMDLPDAHFKNENALDKMSYYNQADADSMKRKQSMKDDPFYSLPDEEVDSMMSETEPDVYSNSIRNNSNKGGYQHPAEAKMYSRLQELDKALNDETPVEENTLRTARSVSSRETAPSEIDKLEKMMGVMQQDGGADPEMEQLNGMMDKILDMQHPERVTERLRQASAERKGRAYAVTGTREADPISLLDVKGYNRFQQQPYANGFFTIDTLPTTNSQNIIEAVVHENQTIIAGSTVKLRLLNDIFINGLLVPSDQFVFGTASMNGDRLKIQINSIRSGSHLFPVAINVYDLDGMEGINIPGAITRDVAKQSADRSMQNIGISGVNPSWQVQAAGAGVEAAKSLFSKKVKLVKVTLKAGYKVWLYDEKQKQSDK